MAVRVRSGPSPPGPPSAHGEATAARVCLLGGFEVSVSGLPVRIPASAERLLAFLAFHTQALHRHFVSGTLWPDTTDGRAAGNLRSSLWRLRRAGHPLVDITDRRLALRKEVSVDVHELIDLVSRGADPALEISHRELASLAAPTELLPGWGEDWVLPERERFRQLRLHGLEALSERLVTQKRFAAAVEIALAALREEPLRESGQSALIRAFLAEGNVCEAVRQFKHYRGLLRAELGIEPSMELVRLLDGRIDRPSHVVTNRRFARQVLGH